MVLEVGDQQGASRGSTTGLGSCHPMEAAQRPWLVSEHIPRAAGGFNVVKRRHRGMLLGVVRRQGGEAFSFIVHLSGGLDPILPHFGRVLSRRYKSQGSVHGEKWK